MATLTSPRIAAPGARTAPTATPFPVGRRSARSRTAWNVAAVTVIWLTSLFVVALWVTGGGVQDLLSGSAATLNTLGRVTGLVSANLLLYQVLLMARIPLFERGFGHDGMTRMHRLVGFWSFWLLMAHIVLLVAGYAAQAAINPLVQLWQFIWEYPGMLLATAGTILLVMIVITSIRRARRKLRYESWHLLHLYGYLGVGLAIPHMLWTGADFLASPLATAYWWGLWAATAAAVLVWRVGVPLGRSWRHGLRVAGVRRDGRNGIEVRMTGRDVARLRAEPGQFFVWRFLDGAGWSRGHPFSLAAAPDANELTISARVLGDGTRRMTRLKPGTRVLFEGPYGHMTESARTGSKLLMIGAGAGVAPLVSILEGAAFAPGAATLLTRDHADADALRLEAIGRLVAERGVRHFTLNGPRSHSGSAWLPAGITSKGPDVIRSLAPDLAAYDVYLCGPVPWMDEVTRDLRAAGVAPDRIHSEAFAV